MDLGLDFKADEDAEVVAERPALAGALILVVAAVAWVGVSLATGGGVDPVRTVLFAVAFTAVYLGFALYYP